MYQISSLVGGMTLVFVNVYFVGEPGGAWTLVDTGLPGCAERIVSAAETRYGVGARPQAIVLTHGHFDHCGTARILAERWNVPIYVHRDELPYVTGQSKYPPSDPTIGGAMAFMCRFIPQLRTNLGDRVRVLPDEGAVPTMPGWKWLHTPGHSPGHVSLYHVEDGTLLAGDAFATVDLDSLPDILTQHPQLARPPSPFTCDWQAARESARDLARLEPRQIGCGHGKPVFGPDIAARLQIFADHFPMPARGRYAVEPARTDAQGVESLPPAPSDPLPRIVATIGIAALTGLLFAAMANRVRNWDREV